MFGLNEQEVLAVLNKWYVAKRDAEIEEGYAAAAATGEHINSQLEKLKSSFDAELRHLSATSDSVSASVEAKLSAIDSFLGNEASTIERLKDSVSEVYARSNKALGTAERIVSVIELGEAARTNFMKELSKAMTAQSSVLSDSIARIEATFTKISQTYEEQATVSRLTLKAILELSDNFVAAVSGEEDDIDIVAVKKARRKKS